MKVWEMFADSLICGISERVEGNMRVAKNADLELTRNNRDRFFEKPEFANFKRAAAVLEHSEKVTFVNEHGIFEGDALITNKPMLLLTVTAADCMPIYFFDVQNNIIALAHAGRLGIEKGIIENTVGSMISKNLSRPENIAVHFGPYICGMHYPTNLKQEAIKQLLSLGINQEQIVDANLCTFEHHDQFFSYRREKPVTPEAQVAFIGLLQ